MKNINNQQERVEVMALFGYEMTPCQPLSFKRRGEGQEIEVTELLGTTIRFVGQVAIHIFDVVASGRRYRLEFNAEKLVWMATAA